MEYNILRDHRRKRMVIVVTPTGEIIVKAGKFTSDNKIDEFVRKNTAWIEKQKKYFETLYHHRITVTSEEREIAKKQLLPVMRDLVEQYSVKMDVVPKSVKITVAEKRWGSCGADSSVCFSYRCAYLSQKCREYIVVHELSHIKEHNHSKNFYAVLEQYMPDYKTAEKELEGYYIHLKK